MENIKEKKYYKAFIAVLMIVLLSCCVFVGTVLAWLTDEDIHKTVDIIEIGAVDFDIYHSGAPITSLKHNSTSNSAIVVSPTSRALEVLGGSTIRNIDLTIRNTGTVSAIMRVTLAIYYIDENGDRCPCILAESSTFDNHISITNSGWVNDFSNINNGNEASNTAATGYTYYNSQIHPYTIRTAHNLTGEITEQNVTAHEVPVITQMLVPESKKNLSYFIEVIQVDGVAYAGNIYQEDTRKGGEYDVPVTAYPFGHVDDLPTAWTAWK